MTTIRDQQKPAVAALADLLDLDLPPLMWSVTHHWLIGQPTGDDAERTEAVNRWASVLDANVTVATYDTYVSHNVTAEHMGVEVTVFTHTRVTYDYQIVSKAATR